MSSKSAVTEFTAIAFCFLFQIGQETKERRIFLKRLEMRIIAEKGIVRQARAARSHQQSHGLRRHSDRRVRSCCRMPHMMRMQDGLAHLERLLDQYLGLAGLAAFSPEQPF